MSMRRAVSAADRFIPGTASSYRFSGKVIGVILACSLGLGIILELLGHPLYAGLTVALGFYLVLCSILFITIPVIAMDIFLD